MTVLLHGFWGQPSDWNPVLERLPLAHPVAIPDLYESGELAPNVPLDRWSENFWNWCERQAGSAPLDLVGYSMGGRLALSAVCARPERVGSALILSANPCLDRAAMSGREEWEADWSEKFLHEDWSVLESSWQEQPVFSGSAVSPRRKNPGLREALGLSLKNWSPLRHPFTGDQVKALPIAVEWAFGALDQKYLEVAKSLQELPVRGQISIVPDSGHRLIADAAGFVANWMQKRGI